MSPSYGVELFTPAARQRITRSLREKGGYQDILGSGDDADGFCLSDEEFLEIMNRRGDVDLIRILLDQS